MTLKTFRKRKIGFQIAIKSCWITYEANRFRCSGPFSIHELGLRNKNFIRHNPDFGLINFIWFFWQVTVVYDLIRSEFDLQSWMYKFMIGVNFSFAVDTWGWFPYHDLQAWVDILSHYLLSVGEYKLTFWIIRVSFT